MRYKNSGCAIAAILVLSACGGGDDASTPQSGGSGIEGEALVDDGLSDMMGEAMGGGKGARGSLVAGFFPPTPSKLLAQELEQGSTVIVMETSLSREEILAAFTAQAEAKGWTLETSDDADPALKGTKPGGTFTVEVSDAGEGKNEARLAIVNS